MPERDRPNTRRRRFRLRLAGPRIGRGRDEFADTGGRRGFVAPMDGGKQRAATLQFAAHDPENASAIQSPQLCESTIDEPCRCRVLGMDLDERLADMVGEPWAQARACHGMPLVAHAAGIEHERKLRRRLRPQGRLLRRDQTGLAVARVKVSLGEEAAVGLRHAVAHWPLHRLERVELFIVQPRQGADVEIAGAAVLERRQRGVLAEDVGRRAIPKVVAESQTARDLRDDPPVRPGFSRRRQKRTLARNAPFGIRHRAVFFTPGGGRQQDMGAGIDGVIRPDIVGNDEQIEPAERLAHPPGARQRHRRIGRHHPQRLDLAARDGLEHIHRLEAFPLRHRGRAPEASDPIDIVGHEIHMGGKLIGEPAHFAPAHRVGLAGERERSHARFADAAGSEVAIDDRGDLVSPLRGLVHALRKRGDHLGRGGKEREKSLNVTDVESTDGARCGDIWRNLAGAGERLGKTGRVPVDEVFV
jgi:hypothetical protein